MHVCEHICHEKFFKLKNNLGKYISARNFNYWKSEKKRRNVKKEKKNSYSCQKYAQMLTIYKTHERLFLSSFTNEKGTEKEKNFFWWIFEKWLISLK